MGMVCSLTAKDVVIEVKNSALYDTLKIEFSVDKNVEINKKDVVIKPQSSEKFILRFKNSNDKVDMKVTSAALSESVSLVSEKDYFGNIGLKYTDDYSDYVNGDITEDILYKNIRIII